MLMMAAKCSRTQCVKIVGNREDTDGEDELEEDDLWRVSLLEL